MYFILVAESEEGLKRLKNPEKLLKNLKIFELDDF